MTPFWLLDMFAFWCCLLFYSIVTAHCLRRSFLLLEKDFSYENRFYMKKTRILYIDSDKIRKRVKNILAFGDVLNKIMEEHKISKSSFCEKLGISRSLLYRYLSEKSIMPFETKELMKREFMMTPAERSTLDGAYEASLIGHDRHLSRMLIDEMVNSGSMEEGILSIPDIMDIDYVKTVTSKQLSVLYGEQNVRMVLRYILSCVGQSGKKEDVFVTAQPDNNVVMSELSLFLSSPLNNCVIYHIFKLYRNETLNMATPLSANLALMQNMIKFIFPIETNSRYHAAYYYEQYMGNNPTAFADSGRVITSSFALLILADCKQAILINDPEMIAIYSNQLAYYHSNSTPFTQLVNLPSKSSVALLKKVNLCGEANFFPEPVLSFTRTASFSNNKVDRKNTIGYEALTALQEKSIQLIQKGKLAYTYFSLDGLQKFIQTGLFGDLNEKFMNPLKSEHIKLYLGEIILYATKHENVIPLLIQNNALRLFKGFSVRIYYDSQIWMCRKDSGPDSLVILDESSLVKALSDYFFNVYPQKFPPDAKANAMQAMQAAIDAIAT